MAEIEEADIEVKLNAETSWEAIAVTFNGVESWEGELPIRFERGKMMDARVKTEIRDTDNVTILAQSEYSDVVTSLIKYLPLGQKKSVVIIIN